ncbi:MAG TPA: hypothetical protein VG412_06580 [Acidimicrobiales bacterium]|nr:hypothetical protein [Acidimicrobiales bacterium]
MTAPAVVTDAHQIISMASGDGVMAGEATFWYRLPVDVSQSSSWLLAGDRRRSRRADPPVCF